jgi:hypothetical protein
MPQATLCHEYNILTSMVLEKLGVFFFSTFLGVVGKKNTPEKLHQRWLSGKTC